MVSEMEEEEMKVLKFSLGGTRMESIRNVECSNLEGERKIRGATWTYCREDMKVKDEGEYKH